MLNVKSFFMFRILVETKEKLFPLLLSRLLRIMLLLPIFIFISLALWCYLFLLLSAVKIIALCLANVLFLPYSFGWKNQSCSGRAVFCFILFCQSLGISFAVRRLVKPFVCKVYYTRYEIPLYLSWMKPALESCGISMYYFRSCT